jgi:hypothetical protein
MKAIHTLCTESDTAQSIYILLLLYLTECILITEWRKIFQAPTNVILQTESYTQTCYLSGEFKLLSPYSLLLQLLKSDASPTPLYIRAGGGIQWVVRAPTQDMYFATCGGCVSCWVSCWCHIWSRFLEWFRKTTSHDATVMCSFMRLGKRTNTKTFRLLYQLYQARRCTTFCVSILRSLKTAVLYQWKEPFQSLGMWSTCTWYVKINLDFMTEC